MKVNNKNYTVLSPSLVVLYSFLVLTGCGILISYIDTNSAIKKINAAEATINSMNAKIYSQNQINGRLFTQFTEHEIDLTVTPYPALKKLHEKMKFIESKSTLITEKFNLEANKFKKIIAGKSRITEKSPDWKHVNEFYDNYEDDFLDLKDNGLDYHSSLKEFLDITKSNEILILKVSDLSRKMIIYNKQLLQRSNKIEGLISEMNSNIKGRYTRSLSESQLRKLKLLKNKISDFSGYFKYVSKHTSEIFSKINIEIAGYNYLWTEKNMKVRTLFSEIEQTNNNINIKIEKLRDSWNAI